MHTVFLCLRKYLADCVQILWMVRDCLATSFPHVMVGVLLHMCTCMPRFYIPVTARPIVFKLSVRLGTGWATIALPCIFRNAWASRLGPGEKCEILFSICMKPCIPPRHFKQAATPTRTQSRLIPASRNTAVPSVMLSTSCLGWRAARPTDPVEIARVAGLRLIRSHACQRKTQNTWSG